MKTADIIGLIVILAIVGAGAYFLLSQPSATYSPPGSSIPPTTAQPPGTPNAAPQPTPQAPAGSTRPTNEFDAGIAGINAGKDVLLAGLKMFGS